MTALFESLTADDIVQMRIDGVNRRFVGRAP